MWPFKRTPKRKLEGPVNMTAGPIPGNSDSASYDYHPIDSTHVVECHVSGALVYRWSAKHVQVTDFSAEFGNRHSMRYYARPLAPDFDRIEILADGSEHYFVARHYEDIPEREIRVDEDGHEVVEPDAATLVEMHYQHIVDEWITRCYELKKMLDDERREKANSKLSRAVDALDNDETTTETTEPEKPHRVRANRK